MWMMYYAFCEDYMCTGLASHYDQMKDKTATVNQAISVTAAIILNLIATITCP